MYCLFAEDTGIFQPNIFRRYLEEKTNIDGSDVGSKLTELFQILDTKIENRQSNLDEDLQIFSYINGDLFSEDMTIPSLTSEMRKNHKLLFIRLEQGFTCTILVHYFKQF